MTPPSESTPHDGGGALPPRKAPELSRIVKLRQITARPVVVEADDSERAALARRFAISAVRSLRAEIRLDRDGDTAIARGRLVADIDQACAISGEDFPVAIDETLAFRFVPPTPLPEAKSDDEIEIELAAQDCDEIEYSGSEFDLGEAVAQSLALAIDPYAEGPNADAARQAAGIESDDAPRGPLADALAALKKD